jgi:hypothetical protein
MLKCLVLINGTVLIGKIEEVAAELGDPNCQVSDHYEITPDGLKTWLNFTNDDKVMLRSENILTIVEPDLKTVKEYESIKH